jgi:hypothetical protein
LTGSGREISAELKLGRDDVVAELRRIEILAAWLGE